MSAAAGSSSAAPAAAAAAVAPAAAPSLADNIAAYLGNVRSMFAANYQAMPGTSLFLGLLLVLGTMKFAWYSKNVWKYHSLHPPSVVL